MKHQFTFRIAIVILTLFVCESCGRSEYTVKVFTYPEGTKAHKMDWEYMTQVIVSSSHTPITDKSEKKVKILIVDNSKHNLMEKQYVFTCASIRSYAVWNEFKTLNLKLREEGNKYAKDPYNEELITKGPKVILNLTCIYDDKQKKYLMKKEIFPE